MVAARRHLRAVRQGLRRWLLVGEQRGVDEKAAQRSSITCYLNLSTCQIMQPPCSFQHICTHSNKACKEISFKLFLNAMFGTKLNVKRKASVWSRRNSEGKIKHCHCQILQPGCSEIQLFHLVVGKDTASSCSLAAKSHSKKKNRKRKKAHFRL